MFAAFLALGWWTPTFAQQSLTVERSASVATLFSSDEVGALAKTLPADQVIHFRVRIPAGGESSGAESAGVLVYISPTDSGELPASWAAVLDEKQLLWIAADGSGNSRPTAERMLVAVMALKLAQRENVNPLRLYVSGMSGGGRVASQCISHFPRFFSGAIFIVGADFYLPEDPGARALLAGHRLVFLTGSRDFNRREIRGVHDRYRDSGVTRSLLIDAPGFGHELARPAQLRAAIDFLDAR
jgi:hypothetical protein